MPVKATIITRKAQPETISTTTALGLLSGDDGRGGPPMKKKIVGLWIAAAVMLAVIAGCSVAGQPQVASVSTTSASTTPTTTKTTSRPSTTRTTPPSTSTVTSTR